MQYKIFYKKGLTKDEVPRDVYLMTTNTELELEILIVEADDIDDAFEKLKEKLGND